ncbi:MAG: ABC transporter permease [Deltaproteobacteria bacterium]|nr:ABC transporter permease [Deltaproteobacteria bacterium]
MSLNRFLGFRFLFHRHHSALFYFLSLLSVALIALSLMAFLSIQAILSGFEEDLRDKVLGMNPHLRIMLSDQDSFESLEAKLNQDKNVLALQRVILGEALLKLPQAKASQGVQLMAFAQDPRRFTSSLRFSALLDFAWEDLKSKENQLPSLVIGEELVKEMGLIETVDQELDLIYPFGQLGPTGSLEPIKKTFAWRSNFTSGYFDADSRWVLLNLSEAKALLGDFARRELWVFLKDSNQALAFAKKWPGLQIKPWQEEHSRLFSALSLERWGARLLLVLLLALGVLTLMNVNFLLVLERRLEITLLKALGLSVSKIKLLFSQMALFLGSVGGLVGLVGAWLFCTWIQSTPFALPQAYYVEKIPVHWRWDHGLLAFVFLIFLCFLSARLPAKRSIELSIHE